MKKLLLVLGVILSFSINLFAQTNPDTKIFRVVSVTGTNLALNQTYSSSSDYNAGQVAANAFDGSIGTNWQSVSGTFDDQWLCVHFATATVFNTVVLSEWDNRTLGFRIEYSNDGTTWSTAFTGTNIGTNKIITFPSINANYARIYFTKGVPGLNLMPIIYEFEIYNQDLSVNGANLALNKTYSSSSDHDAGQVASNAFDNSLGTNWQSAVGTFVDQWLAVDFGTATTFNSVNLSEYGNRTLGFRIEYSTDGTTWSTAHTGTHIGNNSFISFPAITANFARIYFTLGVSDTPIIYEFEIYNSTVTSILPEKAIPETNSGISRLYPNPAKDELSVVYNSAKDDQLIISVLNIAGQELQVKKGNVLKGQNFQMIDISKLSDGLYFIKTNAVKASVKSFIVRN